MTRQNPEVSLAVEWQTPREVRSATSRMTTGRWGDLIRAWAKEQAAAAPPLTEEAARLIRGALRDRPATLECLREGVRPARPAHRPSQRAS
jgi:hypothetical protein